MITTIATKRKKGPRGPGSNNDTLHYGLFIITTAARNGLWRLTFLNIQYDEEYLLDKQKV